MLIEAKEKEIPVLYCMNRRRLAKAIGSSFRQSAVAICDADGAYSEFKKILTYIESYVQSPLPPVVSMDSSSTPDT